MELQFIVRYLDGSSNEVRVEKRLRGYRPLGNFPGVDHHALFQQDAFERVPFREPPLFNFNVMSSVPYSVTIETESAGPQIHTQLQPQIGGTPSRTSQMARAQALNPHMATTQRTSAVLPFYMHFVAYIQRNYYVGTTNVGKTNWYFCRFWINVNAPPGFQGWGYHRDQLGRICFDVLLPATNYTGL